MSHVRGVFCLLFALCLLLCILSASLSGYLLLEWVPWVKYWAMAGATLTGLIAGFRRGRHWLAQLMYCVALPIALFLVGSWILVVGMFGDSDLTHLITYENPSGEYSIALREVIGYHHIIQVKAYSVKCGTIWMDPIELPDESRRTYGENVHVRWISDAVYHIETGVEGRYWQGDSLTGEIIWMGLPESASDAGMDNNAFA